MTTEPYAAQQQVITGRIELVGRIIILAAGLLLLCRDLTGTYTGWREDNNALYSQFARNYICYGFGNTKLFQTYGCAQTMPANPQRYLNHPPLLPVWVAMAMAVFGDHEWVGRLIPITTTLGSAWLLMVIVSRFQSPIIGLLSGVFYLMLPMVAYFGRMLDHESPVQFFSLLMLHGYLQWAGLYGGGYNQKAGAVYYILGVVLGIGTGWAAVIMAGLIWLWYLWRVFHNYSSRRFLFWLAVIPVVSLAAVIIHILWGAQWDIGWLKPLFLSRTVGTEVRWSWQQWLSYNRSYFAINISPFGTIAAIFYLAIIPSILRFSSPDSPFRQIVRNNTSVVPILLTGLQGLIWIVLFKYQSGLHEYWQYFVAPFFAVAMAAVVLTVFTFLTIWTPRFSAIIAVLMILLPVPFLSLRLNAYYDPYHKPLINKGIYDIRINDLVLALKRLNEIVPPRVPVLTSNNYVTCEQIRDSVNCRIMPTEAYYANRPLIYTTDINEIEANRQNCAAYILRATNDPNMYQLAQKLGERYKLVGIERDYMIFLLTGQPKGD